MSLDDPMRDGLSMQFAILSAENAETLMNNPHYRCLDPYSKAKLHTILSEMVKDPCLLLDKLSDLGQLCANMLRQ